MSTDIHNPFDLLLDEETNKAVEFLIRRINKLEQELTALGAKVESTITIKPARPKTKKVKRFDPLTKKQREALQRIHDFGMNVKSELFAASTIHSLERRGYIVDEVVQELRYDYPPRLWKTTELGNRILGKE